MPRYARRQHGDRGAVAVLTAVVVALALVPVSALGLSAYTRSATGAELARAADAGALAGAASIPLVDLAALPAFVAGEELAQVALDAACTRARRAAAVEGTLARTYVIGPRAGGAPRPGCTATWTPDSAVAACVGAVAGRVDGVLGSPTVDPLVQQLVRVLLPAAFRNGIQVELRWEVRGPLDGVFRAAPRTQVAVARARRRFNPLGVDTPLPPAVTQLLSVEELRESVGDALDDVADAADGVQPGCGAGVDELAEDVDDALQVKGEEETLVECAVDVAQDVVGSLPGTVGGVVGQLPVPLPGGLPLPLPTASASPAPPSLDLDLDGCQRGVFRAQLAG